MNTNFDYLVESLDDLTEDEKARLVTYFKESITYINSNYKHEELYKKQLVVWMIRNLINEIKLNEVQSFIDDWFKRTNINSDEIIKLKGCYYYYEDNDQLYLGIAEKIMQERRNNGSLSGLLNLVISLFTLQCFKIFH